MANNSFDPSNLSREEIQRALKVMKVKGGGSYSNQELQMKKALEAALRNAPSSLESVQSEMDARALQTRKQSGMEELFAEQEEAITNDRFLRENGVNPGNVPDADEAAKVTEIKKNQEEAKKKAADDARERATGGRSQSNPLIGGISNVSALAEAEARLGKLPEAPDEFRYETMPAGAKFNPVAGGDIIIKNPDGSTTLRRKVKNPDFIEWQANRARMLDDAKNSMASSAFASGGGLIGGGKPPTLSQIDYGIEADAEKREARKAHEAAINDPENPLSPEEREVANLNYIDSTEMADKKLRGLTAANPNANPNNFLIGGPSPGAQYSLGDVQQELGPDGFTEEQLKKYSGNVLIGNN